MRSWTYGADVVSLLRSADPRSGRLDLRLGHRRSDLASQTPNEGRIAWLLSPCLCPPAVYSRTYDQELRPTCWSLAPGPRASFSRWSWRSWGSAPRVVDAAAGPGTTSRALAVQARTLEILPPGRAWRRTCSSAGWSSAASTCGGAASSRPMSISSVGGHGSQPVPLRRHLPARRARALAHRASRRRRHHGRAPHHHHVDRRAVTGSSWRTANGPDGAPVAFEARYLAGCDGARSVTRGAIGVGFPGGTYEHLFYVADVTARGNGDEPGAPRAPRRRRLPRHLPARWRGARAPGRHDPRRVGGRTRTLTWEDVDRRPIDRIGLEIDRVNWFSTYRVHHRVADSFRAAACSSSATPATFTAPSAARG